MRGLASTSPAPSVAAAQQLLNELVVASDQHLGASVAGPKAVTKLPHHLLTTDAAAVRVVVASTLAFVHSHGAESVAQLSGEQVVALVGQLARALEAARLWSAPRVFIASGEAALAEIVARHGGRAVDAPHHADIVVVTDSADAGTAPQLPFVVRSWTAGAKVLHWPRRPDSYDAVVAAGATGALATSPPVAKPVCVASSWVLDLERFNEWPNVVDYLRPATGGVVHAERLGIKRSGGKVRGDSTAAIVKRAKPDVNDERLATDGARTSVLTPLQSERPVAPASLHGDVVSLLLPASASWFSIDAVHQIERDTLPDFFATRDATLAYRDYRDFMVHAYWQQPQHYLTYTACRKSLSGDVGSILRVHAFLEQHGIINYQVTCNTLPTALPLVADTAAAGRAAAPLELASARPPLLATRRDAMAAVDTSGLRYVCASCAGPCRPVRYENLKDEAKQVWESEVTLCEGCFTLGKLPSGWRANQFVAREAGSAADPLSAGLLTQDETLALLSALEKHGEDWTRVAQQVGGGKTEQECLLHFVRLPIQDQHVGSTVTTEVFGAPEHGPLQLAAYLAATVSPAVASAAAVVGGSANSPSTSAAVAAAGQRAALLAEREAQRAATLLGRALQLQLRGLEARLAKFGELEAFVEERKAQLRREMLQLQMHHLQ